MSFDDKPNGCGCLGILIGLVFSLGAWAVIGYVIGHFIVRYW